MELVMIVVAVGGWIVFKSLDAVSRATGLEQNFRSTFAVITFLVLFFGWLFVVVLDF